MEALRDEIRQTEGVRSDLLGNWQFAKRFEAVRALEGN
jgi:hypothetical protein